MSRPLAWRRSRGHWVSVASSLALSVVILANGMREHDSTMGKVLLTLAALMIPAALYHLWQELRRRKIPAATLDSTLLTIWGPLHSKPEVIALEDVAAVESEPWGSVWLRMRTGDLRQVQPLIRKRDRNELLSALRQALAERPLS